MNLQFKRFQREHYLEYASWFADAELNQRIGPMDQAWLDAVLSEPETQGITWAVLRDGELVAVVETVFDPDDAAWAAIPALAVRPALRQQGIGEAVLRALLAMHEPKGITEHRVMIKLGNDAARRCAEKVGFAATGTPPNEHGYVAFRRSTTRP